MAVWPDWRSTVTFSEDGPGVTLLHESPELKVVLVGLGVEQALPVHPGPSASFHFLEGEGVMVVGTEEVEVAAGATVVVPTGVSRGVRATSRLVFLGSLGDPAS
ncbi:MAG TPA: cupin domain-containing protein, partial [Dermatophilaceae bacterium]